MRRGAVRAALVAAALVLGASAGVADAATSSPLPGAKLLVTTDNPARQAVERLRGSRPQDARALERIASQSVAIWPSQPYVRVVARAQTLRAARSGSVPVFVAYDIPKRDCYGSGAQSDAEYERYIADLAAGIGSRRAAVILEPDALAAMDCLSPSERTRRERLLRNAVHVLDARTNAAVYLDGGNAIWKSPAVMAPRLIAAGVRQARGFSVNVANFVPTGRSVAFAKAIERRVGGGARAVVDVGRNGNGVPQGSVCNPRGAALGRNPTTRTGDPAIDAYLWIKPPGESDGGCNGGPGGGSFWVEYAIGLARGAT